MSSTSATRRNKKPDPRPSKSPLKGDFGFPPFKGGSGRVLFFIIMRKPNVKIQLFIATSATIFGICLIAVAIMLPPAGYIDPTVLTAYGETLTFAGALIGVDYHYKSKNP